MKSASAKAVARLICRSRSRCRSPSRRSAAFSGSAIVCQPLAAAAQSIRSNTPSAPQRAVPFPCAVLDQQGLDTTTPAGRAMFQMLGVFAEFERSIIQERVRAGLQRARREGKRLGRPPIADKLAERIRTALAGGMSVRKTAAKFDVNPSTVQRIARPFDDASVTA